MLTKEQEEKAKEALYLRLPMFQNFEKEIAFNNHKTAIEWIDKYNLPYRVSLNHLKDMNPDYVSINPCYPFPGYNMADLIHLTPDDIAVLEDLTIIPTSPIIKQQIEEHNKKLIPWDLSTAAGLDKWKYYFAHFINGAQLNSFNMFDWFGVKIGAPNEEQQKMIDFWLCLQADYHMHPDKYMQEEPLKANYNLDEYTHLGFVIDWDNKNESTQYSNSMM